MGVPFLTGNNYSLKLRYMSHKFTYSIYALTLLIITSAHSQVAISYNVVFKDTLITEKYEERQTEFKNCSLQVDPGDYRIINQTAAHLLQGFTITGVDLVYSDYPKGDDFTDLNRKRLLELYMHCPQAFGRNVVKWRMVKQTGVKRQGDLHKFFHGFVVYYRPIPPYSEESDLIDNIVKQKESPKDSSLLKVFLRNKEWKDMLVVCDVTGSMSPYTAQLMLWLKLNSALKTAKQFVFFNDDEEKSNLQDKGFDTKGIWTVQSDKLDKVIDTAKKAMNKGAHIENNLEAIFYGIKKYPENKKNVIMIADNWEDPCDMNLLPKLKEQKIPVRIIVCGVENTFNTKYLDIAYATGGSVHTMEHDLRDLNKLAEGKTIKLNGMEFKLSGGRFVQVK
jgi:hypothetical protein